MMIKQIFRICRVKRFVSTRNLSSLNQNSVSSNTNVDIKFSPSQEFVNSLSSEQLRQYEIVKEECKVLSYVAYGVPERLTDEDWKNIMEIDTKRARLKHLEYLYKKEMWDIRNAEKKILKSSGADDEQRKTVRDDYQRRAEQGELLYKPGYNTMFSKYMKDRMTPIWYARMAMQQIVGCPQVVFDMSWLTNTLAPVRSLTLRQLTECYRYNRSHRNPFELFFTGIDLEADWWKKALRSTLSVFDYERRERAFLPTTITDKSYLDLFNKEDLIYLSPGSPYTMNRFHPGKVYIIGAVVDKFDKNLSGPFSVAKAKKEGIRCERFPLHRHVKWETGSKTLTLNATLAILLNVYKTNNWTKALVESVPRRHLTPNQPHKIAMSKINQERTDYKLQLLDDFDNSS